jgi:Holliday junction resolvase RusA-like endonuclease
MYLLNGGDMAKVEFILKDKIIPYVRMTRNGKWVDKRAQEYLSNKDWLIRQMKDQEVGTLAEKTPLAVSILIETPTPYKGDLDNIVKAILDAAQHVVFRNDCWISEIYARRVKTKHYQAKVIIKETV